MAFFRVDGYALDALIEDFDMSDVSVEQYDRNSSMALEGISYAPKKEITLTTNFMTASVAFALENWVRGRHNYWDFTVATGSTIMWTPNSKDAGLAFAGSGMSMATLGLFGTHSMFVAGNGTTTVTAPFGTEGDFTITCYLRQYNTGSYAHTGWVKRGSSTTYGWVGAASTNGVAYFSIVSTLGYTAFNILGKSGVSGASLPIQVDGVRVYPYALSNEQLTALNSPYFATQTTGFARPPFVMITGDALQKSGVNVNLHNEGGGQWFKGFVDNVEVQPVSVGGTFVYNARRLRLKFTER